MRRFPFALALVLSTACGSGSGDGETTTGADDDSTSETAGEVPCQSVGDWAGACCELEMPCDRVLQTCSDAGNCTADGVSNPDAVRCIFNKIIDKETFAFEVQRPAGGSIQSVTTYWVTGEYFVAYEQGSSDGLPLDDWFTCRKPTGPTANPCSTESDPGEALSCIQVVCNSLAPLGSCGGTGGGSTTGDGDGTTTTGDGDGDSGCVFVCGDESDTGVTTGPVPDLPPLPDDCDNVIEYACPG